MHGLQGALQLLTANQCDNLTSVTFQLPSSAPLRELNMAGMSGPSLWDRCLMTAKILTITAVLTYPFCIPGRPLFLTLAHRDSAAGSCSEVLGSAFLIQPMYMWSTYNAGCTNLGKVIFACPQLISLNVSGNSSLTHLAVKCTALESLRAAQCPRLDGLQEGFCCPALLYANFAGCRSLTGMAGKCLDDVYALCAASHDGDMMLSGHDLRVPS